MISYLSGLIIDKEEKYLVVLTNGIGYKVFATTDTVSESKMDQKVQLFIHTAVREDDISLYGFKNKEELKFFELLLGVSGVGPKVGLEILATPIHLTQNAILSGDIAVLTKIKGLGGKTAGRLVLELKNKITPIHIGETGVKYSQFNDDAISALEGLGYERFQIIKAMATLPKEITETEEIVKFFLKSA